MSHFNACVIISIDKYIPATEKEEDYDSAFIQMFNDVKEILDDFNINKEVTPYKSYVIQKPSNKYTIDQNDLKAIAEKLILEYKETFIVDENGIYTISTNNPNGHLDYFNIGDELYDIKRFKSLVFKNFMIRAIITPDKNWTSGPWIYGTPNQEQEKELKKWEETTYKILDDNPNAMILLIDCHI